MSKPDIESLFLHAQRAANKAAELILKSHLASENIFKKGGIDLVTDVDMAVNKLLCDELSAVSNQIDIIAEEGVPSQLRKPKASLVWAIDPIDGTTNFVHGLMHSAISIALYDQVNSESLLAIVYNPFREEFFFAKKGGGAFLNNSPIKVSQTKDFSEALIGTGFPYDRKTNPDNNLAEFSAIMPIVRGIRRFGAASLDLAYVAAGRLDGYFEKHLHFWDYAAGMLLVKEAGGIVSCYDGTSILPHSGHIIASNPKINSSLIDLIAKTRKSAGFNIIP